MKNNLQVNHQEFIDACPEVCDPHWHTKQNIKLKFLNKVLGISFIAILAIFLLHNLYPVSVIFKGAVICIFAIAFVSYMHTNSNVKKVNQAITSYFDTENIELLHYQLSELLTGTRLDPDNPQFDLDKYDDVYRYLILPNQKYASDLLSGDPRLVLNAIYYCLANAENSTECLSLNLNAVSNARQIPKPITTNLLAYEH